MQTMGYIIGVDFDNTIVSYDRLIHKIALERGLITGDARKSKKSIRDKIRELPNGEEKWQRLQAIIYGPRIKEAELVPGVERFFRLCKKNKLKVFVISHKTEFAGYDETKTNLRSAALDWMVRNKFFKDDGLSFSRGNVYFEGTRRGKIEKIKQLGCTHYIDDLEETFKEASFPKGVKKILLDAHKEHSDLQDILVFSGWDGINEYFFNQDDIFLQENMSMLYQAFGSKVTAVERICGGRNSRVHLITCEDSKKYVAKFYFSHESDKRDRLDVEFSSLQFLWNKGIMSIPQPVVAKKEYNFAIYTYINGKKIASEEVNEKDVEYAVEFLSNLDKLKTEEDSSNLPIASEACFSVKEIVESIENRYSKLKKVQREGRQIDALHDFLEKDFMPAFSEIKEWCKKQLDSYGISYSLRIDKKNQTLSPSDFGFHNALREKNGKIIFLDFEYFGWDDPAKMISDFLLHPNMDLRSELKERFVKKMLLNFSANESLEARLKIVFPLFGLKWCLILLNEFLYENFLRRQFANRDKLIKDDLLAEQLSKAKKLLDKILKNFKNFPYDSK